MNKLKLFLVLLLVISIPNIYASCEENQINIDTATATALDALKGIGPVKAEAIIGSRPFDNVDGLINVKGIGEITLNNIKEQGLACVDDETLEVVEEPTQEVVIEETPEEETKEDLVKDIVPLTGKINVENEVPKTETIKLIKLGTPEDIKTEENTETSSINKYALYGFVIFCVLLASLFLFRKKKFENEFD